VARRKGPSASLEMPYDAFRDEPGPDRIHVPVAIAALLMGKEPLRRDQVQMVLGARHRDVKQPGLAARGPHGNLNML